MNKTKMKIKQEDWKEQHKPSGSKEQGKKNSV